MFDTILPLKEKKIFLIMILCLLKLLMLDLNLLCDQGGPGLLILPCCCQQTPVGSDLFDDYSRLFLPDIALPGT